MSQNSILLRSINASGNDGNTPNNVVDENMQTRWSNKGRGSWIKFDLENVERASVISIAWYKGNQRENEFKIEGSLDGNTWNTLFTGTSSGDSLDFETYQIQETPLKFVKITGNGNQENEWVSITEVQINGKNLEFTESSLTAQITLKYTPKPNGQKIINVTPAQRTVHGGQTRDSFYSIPKFSYSAVSDEMFGYFNVDCTDSDDEISFKKMGGRHTGSGNNATTRFGRCYAIGVDFKGNPHLAKEYPHHPSTQKFHRGDFKQVKLADPNFTSLGNLRNKTIGLKVISYITPQNTYKVECWVDRSVLGIDLNTLTNPPNRWELFYTCEDDGSWKYKKGGQIKSAGAPYLRNNGIGDSDGGPMGFYIRIDNVGNRTKAKWIGAVEIIPPHP